jgi:hypothetical protein
VTITATGGGVTKTGTVTLMVPGLSVRTTATSVVLKRGGMAVLTVQTTAIGGFSAPVTFAVAKLPVGVTATFTPATIAAPGTGTTQLKLTAASSTSPGLVALSIQVSAGGVTRTQSVALSVPK